MILEWTLRSCTHGPCGIFGYVFLALSLLQTVAPSPSRYPEDITQLFSGELVYVLGS